MHIPWQKIKTDKDWEDLVLNPTTFSNIRDLESAVKTFNASIKKIVSGKSNNRSALFYGPAGTGKTMTASLLGKSLGKEVYRIDISMIVSKYIGETEKNLKNLFSKVEGKDWILFFDEADALFGKRSNVKDAHDRYANQEVSYFFKQIDQFPGLVILSLNKKNNIDEAFARRFHFVIHFPPPSERERFKLWENVLAKNFNIEKNIDLKVLAQDYELTGSEIADISQFASKCALDRSAKQLSNDDIHEGIRRHLQHINREL